MLAQMAASHPFPKVAVSKLYCLLMEFSENYLRTFLCTCLTHMQSLIKIGGQVSEKNSYGTQRDIHLLLLG